MQQYGKFRNSWFEADNSIIWYGFWKTQIGGPYPEMVDTNSHLKYEAQVNLNYAQANLLRLAN